MARPGGLAADRVSGSRARNEPPQYRAFAGNGGLNWAGTLRNGDHVPAFAGLSRRAASRVRSAGPDRSSAGGLYDQTTLPRDQPLRQERPRAARPSGDRRGPDGGRRHVPPVLLRRAAGPGDITLAYGQKAALDAADLRP